MWSWTCLASQSSDWLLQRATRLQMSQGVLETRSRKWGMMPWSREILTLPQCITCMHNFVVQQQLLMSHTFITYYTRWKKFKQTSGETRFDILRQIIFGAEDIGEKSSTFTRMAVLEARADKKALKKTLAFLPFFMFLVFGFVLGKLYKWCSLITVLTSLLLLVSGTTYLQVNQAFLVVSGMCVFSAASALFMFPAMYLYYQPALVMYKFERADGVGNAYELVIQGFIRFASIALIPVIVSVAIIYLLVSQAIFCSVWEVVKILCRYHVHCTT